MTKMADIKTRDVLSGDVVESVVSVRRVAKVVQGGTTFGFSVMVVAGDGKGLVGYGTGKAKDVMEARAKATRQAKKNVIRIPLREKRTLHHESYGKSGAGLVFLRPATLGKGVIAGGPMRAVFECLGVHDVVAKSIRSSNAHSMVRATFDALSKIRSPRQIASVRGKKIGEIIEVRNVLSNSAG
jgi:small subunit ribosomal protein S5